MQSCDERISSLFSVRMMVYLENTKKLASLHMRDSIVINEKNIETLKEIENN